MTEFGSVVLVPFPFTDLSSAKVRPALVISQSDHPGDDVIVCCISSTYKKHPYAIKVAPSKMNGLKVQSSILLDKIFTLSTSIIRGKLGSIESSHLQKHTKTFRRMFGFHQ